MDLHQPKNKQTLLLSPIWKHNNENIYKITSLLTPYQAFFVHRLDKQYLGL